MAAFCTCCGTAITSKSTACPVCGAPSHGMRAQVAEADRVGDLSVSTEAFGARKAAKPKCDGCYAAS